METGQACISKYSNGLHNETTCSKVLVPRIKVVLGPSTSASCPEFSFKHLLQKEVSYLLLFYNRPLLYKYAFNIH